MKFMKAAMIAGILGIVVLSHSDIESSRNSIDGIIITEGVRTYDIANDDLTGIDDYVQFQHLNGKYYTVKYKILTNRLVSVAGKNNSKDVQKIILEGTHDVELLTERLCDFAENRGLNKAEFLMAFIQDGVKYRLDEYYEDVYERNYSDYHKFPIETLHDKFGDCEDKVILAASMFRSIGYQVGCLEIPGHIILALSGDFQGNCFYVNRQPYYLWEATRPFHKMGADSYFNYKDKRFYEIAKYKNEFYQPQTASKNLGTPHLIGGTTDLNFAF